MGKVVVITVHVQVFGDPEQEVWSCVLVHCTCSYNCMCTQHCSIVLEECNALWLADSIRCKLKMLILAGLTRFLIRPATFARSAAHV